MDKPMCKVSMRTKRVYITWRGLLDQDISIVIRALRKQFGKSSCWAEFLLVLAGDVVEQDEDFVVVVAERDRHAPESEIIRIDILEFHGAFGLYEFLETVDSVIRCNLDRERVGG